MALQLGDLEQRLSGRDRPEVAVLGLPYDENSSFEKGAAEGPDAVEAVLFHEAGNSWTETGRDLAADNAFSYLGRLAENISDPFTEIRRATEVILAAGSQPLFIGGDHSVTYPVIKALSAHHKNLSILHIDAHPDLYDNFDDNPLSHASPFARILEEGLAGRLVQVGIRTLNAHQREQAERFGVEVIEMKDFSPSRIPAFEAPVYLSIDLDGLDPAFAPGVSHPEPGGLSTREVIAIIHSLQKLLVGGDVVEYNPRRDQGGVTAHVAAKFIREMAGVMLLSRARPSEGDRL